MKKLFSILLLSIFMGGCGQQEKIRTVSWYKSHPSERKAMIKKCEENPDLIITPNCVNAIDAM